MPSLLARRIQVMIRRKKERVKGGEGSDIVGFAAVSLQSGRRFSQRDEEKGKERKKKGGEGRTSPSKS